MKTRNHVRILSTAITAVAVVVGVESARAQTTVRVSVSASGAQADNAAASGSISFDGRFVAFESSASNLVAGDTNGLDDIFVRDRTNATVERVSVSSVGDQASGASQYPSISADGRFVVFQSIASNLIAGDTNNAVDVFVRDRVNGTTELASRATNGAQGNFDSWEAGISADGRYVVFTSNASNLVVGDANGFLDVFVRDRVSGTTELLCVSTAGTHGNGLGIEPWISADGRFVAFSSNATNLVAGDTNGKFDIFLRDLQAGTTERVSVAATGGQSNGNSLGASLSADGRYVSFYSTSDDLVAGDTNGHRDAFVRDRMSATTERVSVSTSGAQGNLDCRNPCISADARVVAFEGLSSNLVAGDMNGLYDIFSRDRVSGTTERVSVSTLGVEANAQCFHPALSADGRCVTFESTASNLVAGDTNALFDVFLRERSPPPPSAYCTSGTTSNGCIASIAANANPSVSLANSCSITVTSVEAQKSGIVFYGIDNTGYTPGPWASGSTSSLCVKSPTQRTSIQNSGGTINACNGSFVLDWDAYQSTHSLSLGHPWSVGAKVYAQAWFRDPPAVKSTNLSNALEMTYLP